MPKEIIEKSSNSELLMELIGTLEKEASLFETFLELLEKQQKALIENDVSPLNQITQLQKEKLVAGGRLAGIREKVIGKLALEHKMTGDITIGKLIKCVPSGQAPILEQIRKTILDLYERIARVRSQNAMLIDRSRENIMKTMELLGRFKVSCNNYQKEGKTDNVQTSLALDRRA